MKQFSFGSGFLNVIISRDTIYILVSDYTGIFLIFSDLDSLHLGIVGMTHKLPHPFKIKRSLTIHGHCLLNGQPVLTLQSTYSFLEN